MKVLYLECEMGAAGDMMLSALYELIEDKAGFLSELNDAGIPGVEYTACQVSTHGTSGTHVDVMIDGEAEEYPEGGGPKNRKENKNEKRPHYTTLEYMHAMVDSLELPEETKKHIRNIYDSIAKAEAEVHGTPPGAIHFSKLGTMDAVADITGVCYALQKLKAEKIVISPIHVGCGTIQCSCGTLPVPPPAVEKLLAGAPIYGGEIEGELCTPTGAALLMYFVDDFGHAPEMTTEKEGHGMGTRSFEDRASYLKAVIGEAV
ncbi:MAG: LarC family nickel insertion protein [Eubacteriaceae bacterium]|nr:LarC family nickel insertion protein [Eubacteriaceae bacterium]